MEESRINGPCPATEGFAPGDAGWQLLPAGVLSRLAAAGVDVSPRVVPSKTVLLEAGRVADTLFFIRRGCLRLYFYDKGRDITFQFFFEGECVASFNSLYHRKPSLFFLESIEPSELLAVRKADFYCLLEQEPLLKKAYEEKLIDRFHVYQQLFLSRIKDSPRRRYEALLKSRPDIVRRVPQHYIASYLGITPVSLSRIRNRR